MLARLIDLPEGEVRGWGVFSHGFTLGKESPAAARICKQLAAEGIGMLLAIGVTLLDRGIVSYTVIVAGLVVGTALGVIMARMVRMTSMPRWWRC